MKFFVTLLSSLRSLAKRRGLKQEIDDELRFHLEQRTAQNLATGLSPDEAAREARKRFGNLQTVREQCRETSGSNFGETTLQDIRFAFRQLLKKPGFTAVAVLSLALGISANTTIFSFINSLLFRPPPVNAPNELWQIWRFQPRATSESRRYGAWSRAELAFLRLQNQTLSDLGAFEIEPSFLSWNHNGVGESVQSVFVSGNFFDLCGVRPALGRFFIPAENLTPGTHPVVVVSHSFWRNRLAADPQAIGRTVMVNGTALTVIGVAADDFKGAMAGIAPDLWVPFMMVPSLVHDDTWLTSTDSHSIIGLGRLKPGVNKSQAAAELTVLAQRFAEQIRSDNLVDGAALMPSLMVPLPFRGYIRAFTGILMGAVFLVLLIACANVANLQLVRATGRRQEMAVRSALGAARGRLIRQLLTESIMLAAAGGALGLLLSVWLAQIIAQLIPSSLPVRFATTLDWRVLVFTVVISLLTGVIFGLVPAFRGTRLDLASTLKNESRGAAQRSRFAGILITCQMALCLILLLAATLCLRSLLNARAVNPGFAVQGRVAVSFNLADLGYSTEQAKEFYSSFTSRVRALPGVLSAALAWYLPLGMERSNGDFPVEGRQPPNGESGFFFERYGVGAGYFATTGTSLLRGRDFNQTDREGAPRTVIINEAAAARYWGGENPIGHRLFVDGTAPENAREIIGVVQTGRYVTLSEDPKPVFFECFQQSPRSRATLVVHVQGDSSSVIAAIYAAAREVDSRLALSGVTTMEHHLSLALFPVRTSGLLLGALGTVALALAASGLFGVIAYSVSQRTHEIGIRMALGAQRNDVLGMVLRQGMKLASLGIGIGLIGAIALTRLLRNLLFGVTPTDPITFIAIPILLLAIAWFASWLPTRRATKVDPMVALRHE